MIHIRCPTRDETSNETSTHKIWAGSTRQWRYVSWVEILSSWPRMWPCRNTAPENVRSCSIRCAFPGSDRGLAIYIRDKRATKVAASHNRVKQGIHPVVDSRRGCSHEAGVTRNKLGCSGDDEPAAAAILTRFDGHCCSWIERIFSVALIDG